MRMAAHGARGDLPRLRQFVGGARHRIWAHLGIGAAQAVVLAVALWPLLLDPERRDVAMPALFRLALAVIMRRPISLVIVALAQIALLAAIAEVVVLGLLLPSFGLLVAAYVVLPTADRLQVPGRPTTPQRSASDDG
jgi:hypothetical protein